MQKFNSAGVEIAFLDEGDGSPVLLIHGFASNIRVNWQATGWIKFLKDAGFRVIAIDNRGHGDSAKLYDPAQYSAPMMADDAARLIEHLGLSSVFVTGYSMGARISAFLTMQRPALVKKAVYAGLASRMVTGVAGAEAIAEALEAPSLDDVQDEGGRSFRLFAEQTKSDHKALAACMRSSRVKIREEALARITCPVLVVAGDKDDIAGPVEPLVAAIPGAKGLVLSGKNHMSAVGDIQFKRAVVDFFQD